MSNNSFRFRIINSLEEFEKNRCLWNDLWDRCTASCPLGMSELVAFHTRSYGLKQGFNAIIVESNGKWVAGLPLALVKKAKIIKTAVLPNSNNFSSQFLLDASCDRKSVVCELIAGLRQLPAHLLWFEAIRLDSVEWSVFQQCLDELRISHEVRVLNRTAVLPLDNSIGELEKSWSKKQIAVIKRRYKKLCEIGKVEFVVCDNENDIMNALPICFEIEDRSWKGEGGTSILKKGQIPFFTEQAKLLAEKGKMVVYGLVLDGRWIAFQYCLYDKNTTFSQKLSNESEFRQYGVGQILAYLILQQLAGRSPQEKFDFVGILMPHQQCWNPQETASGQIVLPQPGLMNHLCFNAYHLLRRNKNEVAVMQNLPLRDREN